MINIDDCTNKFKTKNNLKWACIPAHPQRILIIGASGSGKTNALLILITISQILIKYNYMQKIHVKQNINIYLTNGKSRPKGL